MAPARHPEPPAPGSPRLERLLGTILAEVRAAGVLPFDRFVELALYDPDGGYYTRPDRTLGRSGDFYTAAHVHPIFARTVARRVLSTYRELGAPASFELVEAAAGDGTLAMDLLDTWSDPGTPGPRGAHVLVDVPGPRLDALAARIASRPDRPEWPVRVAGGVGDRGPIRGVLLANELLDALPFRRLVRRDGAWRELGVQERDGTLGWGEADLCRPLGPPELPDLPEGAVLEVSEAAEGWIRQAADVLVDGAILLMDFGAEESERLWDGPSGTLAVVRGHRSGVDPFEAPGSADLSAFVNFTRLRAAAARAGLREVAYRRQAEALGAWGLESVVEEAVAAAEGPEAELRIRLAAKRLAFGFERFRVLELAPGRPSGPT